MSIKTNFELPRDMHDIDSASIQGQRLARDLSKNFKSLRNSGILNEEALNKINNSMLDGVEFEQALSSPTGSTSQSFVFTHNFDKIPRGFIVLDSLFNLSTAGASFSATRVSWTETQITIRISIDTKVAAPFSGTFKILVLR